MAEIPFYKYPLNFKHPCFFVLFYLFVNLLVIFAFLILRKGVIESDFGWAKEKEYSNLILVADMLVIIIVWPFNYFLYFFIFFE